MLRELFAVAGSAVALGIVASAEFPEQPDEGLDPSQLEGTIVATNTRERTITVRIEGGAAAEAPAIGDQTRLFTMAEDSGRSGLAEMGIGGRVSLEVDASTRLGSVRAHAIEPHFN